ncbi:hypothetical protein V6N12_027639 [Hibiscus sabdariffa]|uniref:Uncharacterized protein n=1 Tax=Hibiscus sabdariffa TaxID=183260 RepID=A0ABR2F3F8_9ROSI
MSKQMNTNISMPYGEMKFQRHLMDHKKSFVEVGIHTLVNQVSLKTHECRHLDVLGEKKNNAEDFECEEAIICALVELVIPKPKMAASIHTFTDHVSLRTRKCRHPHTFGENIMHEALNEQRHLTIFIEESTKEALNLLKRVSNFCLVVTSRKNPGTSNEFKGELIIMRRLSLRMHLSQLQEGSFAWRLWYPHCSLLSLVSYSKMIAFEDASQSAPRGELCMAIMVSPLFIVVVGPLTNVDGSKMSCVLGASPRELS